MNDNKTINIPYPEYLRLVEERDHYKKTLEECEGIDNVFILRVPSFDRSEYPTIIAKGQEVEPRLQILVDNFKNYLDQIKTSAEKKIENEAECDKKIKELEAQIVRLNKMKKKWWQR